MKYVKRPRSKKSVKRSVRKTTKVSPTIKKYVNNTISKQIENKRYTTEVAETMASPANATNFQSGNMIQFTPSNGTNSLYTLIQGVGQGARSGNVVNLKNAVFRYIMYPLAYNAVSNPTPKPLIIQMYIFSVRRGVLGLTVADAWNIFNTNIFANGSSSIGTLNNIYDLVSVPNNEVVHMHVRRTLKLGANAGVLQTGGNASFSNNDFNYTQYGKINITKYMPKRITFNDGDNNSTSKQLFCVICPYNVDGTTIPSTGFPCAIFYGVDIEYEDA